MRATVLGLGAFGTALANVLSHNCAEVRVFGREADAVDAVNTRRENPRHLPGIPVRANVRATLSLDEALDGTGLVVVAVPSHAVRDVAKRAAPLLPGQVPVVSVVKGIESGTLYTMTEVLEDCLPEPLHPYLAVLSGPSFAKEMAKGMPTVVTVAAQWEKVARRCQKAFNTETFRTYTSSDVVGVQLGGALKNVIAIAAGLADGLGFGHNARAAIITRGLAEITRVAVRRGANPLTLSGLAGMGDLVLTCTGELSRNRRLGLGLGKGQSLKAVLAELNDTVEGLHTAKSAEELSQKTGVELPICHQVYCITHEGKSAKAAVTELMTRQPKPETL